MGRHERRRRPDGRQDLTDALTEHPPALTTFADFPLSTRRNILRWIASAKTPTTRHKRITRDGRRSRARAPGQEQRLTPAAPAVSEPMSAGRRLTTLPSN